MKNKILLLFITLFSFVAAMAQSYGCKDPNAFNYNPNVDIHVEDSCIYNSSGCNDLVHATIVSDTTVSEGSFDLSELVSLAVGGDDYDIFYFMEGKSVSNSVILSAGTTEVSIMITTSCDTLMGTTNVTVFTQEPIYGCKDPYALSYNPSASAHVQDSCFYRTEISNISGCTDSEALNYNPVATISDATCIYQVDANEDIPGCIDEKALNYNAKATQNDNSCVYAQPENTIVIVETVEEIVDTVGTTPVFDNNCSLDGIVVENVKIEQLSLDGSSISLRWTLNPGTDNITFDVAYTISTTGKTLFYLSVLCESEIRSSLRVANNTQLRGFSIGAEFDVEDEGGTVSVPEINSSEIGINIYPNPVTDELNIVSGQEVSLSMYSIDGQIQFIYENVTDIRIPTTKLQTGVYLLRIISESGETNTVKIIKQ